MTRPPVAPLGPDWRETINALPIDEFNWLRDHGWQVPEDEVQWKYLQINTVRKDLRRPSRLNPDTAWRFHIAGV